MVRGGISFVLGEDILHRGKGDSLEHLALDWVCCVGMGWGMGIAVSDVATRLVGLSRSMRPFFLSRKCYASFPSISSSS